MEDQGDSSNSVEEIARSLQQLTSNSVVDIDVSCNNIIATADQLSDEDIDHIASTTYGRLVWCDERRTMHAMVNLAKKLSVDVRFARAFLNRVEVRFVGFVKMRDGLRVHFVPLMLHLHAYYASSFS